MHAFFKRALSRCAVLLVLSIAIGWLCIERSYLSAPLLPAHASAFGWRAQPGADGTSSARVEEADASLRFTLQVSKAVAYPLAEVDLRFHDAAGRALHVDLSRFDAIAFRVRCAPANTLMFSVPTFDRRVSKRGDLLTYRSPAAFFSCTEQGNAVELDLTRLETPQWWFAMFKQDLARKAYALDQVPKIAFGNSAQTPADIPGQVTITDLVLKGRDYRYLIFPAIGLSLAWAGFAFWFFRSHAAALVSDVKARLQKDLPFVAYQQLSIAPHRDKEKAAVLAYIGAHYANPELDLDGVVEHTGVNRSKINEILKSELGFTFSAYLNKLRLTEAARLLSENGNAAIAEIAYSIGYGNVSYFNKLFKEEYGCTPKAFRSACEQGA